MAITAARLTNTGTFLVNGIFDEWTGNPVIDSSLVYWIDAGQTASYPGTGNTVYDLVSGSPLTIYNNSTSCYQASPGSFNLNRAWGQYLAGAGTTATSLATGSSYTMSAWINPTAAGWTTIFAKGNPEGSLPAYGYTLRYASSGNPFLEFAGGTSTYTYDGGNNTLIFNSWTHLLYTWTSSTGQFNLYTNGIAVGVGGSYSLTGPDTFAGGGAGPITVGGILSGDGSGTFSGQISACQIYNRALTAAEAAQNYNALAPRYLLPTISTVTNRAKFTTNTVYSSTFDEYTYNTGSIYTKNLISYSQSFLTSSWGSGTNTVVTPNAAIAPDGTLTATRLQFPLGAGTYLGHSFPSVAGVTYTFSAYVLGNIIPTATIEIEPTLGSGSPFVATNFTASSSSWTRYSVTYTAAATSSTYCVTFDNQGNGVASDIYIWGAQLEVGSTATAYVPTNSIGVSSPNFSYRIDNQANMYVSNYYDEFTGAPVVDSSLTMWIDFGQAASYPGTGSTVQDLSPSKQSSVTLIGAPTFNSLQNGGTMIFNGTSQYGTASGTPLGINAYTKSVWFQVTGALGNNNIISSGAGGHFMFMNGGTTTIYNGHSNWGSYTAFPSTTVFTTNRWYHACLTFNTGTGMVFYVNGVLDSTYNAQLTPLSGNGECDIANYGAGNLFTGNIGQVMCYNRVLTSDEVAQNYNALRRRYGL